MSQPAVIYNHTEAVTKSDSVNLTTYDGNSKRLTDALYVGGAGIVVAVFGDDSTGQFTAVAGEILPLAIKRVNSSTTTATLMQALYQF
jgi:hypothetical protein